MTGESSNGKKGKGFAGLDSMVSDITESAAKDVSSEQETTPELADAIPTAEPLPLTQNEPDTPPESGSRPRATGNAGDGKVGWFIGGGIVVLIWMFTIGVGQDTTTVPNISAPSYPIQAPVEPPPHKNSPPTYPIPSPATAPAPVEIPSSTPSVPLPAVTATIDTNKPPIGRDHVLNDQQIRYCLTEKIRISAIRSILNDTLGNDANRFNARVNDYNARCSEFRYYSGELERIQQALVLDQATIMMSAKKEWVRISEQENMGKSKQGSPTAIQLTPPLKQDNACKNDNECPGSRLCIRGVCSLELTEGKACDRNIECVGSRQCIEGRCSNDNKPAIPITSQQQLKQGASGKQSLPIPANAELDYFGHDWVCMRGYRRVGSECPPVRIPANAELDYFGHDWVCMRGYRRVGSECPPVRIPANAELDYFGHDWVCMRGYRRVGEECWLLQ